MIFFISGFSSCPVKGFFLSLVLIIGLVLLTIFIFGGESIKGFAFALMVGVIIGTYSSLFIATPLVVDLSKNKINA